MTPQAITALQKSIAHWKKIAAGDMREDIGAPTCALCREFNHSRAGHLVCDGCPVKEFTGKAGCLKTPYNSIENFMINMTNGEFITWRRSPEFLAMAAKELAFLKSLLPVEEK